MKITKEKKGGKKKKNNDNNYIHPPLTVLTNIEL